LEDVDEFKKASLSRKVGGVSRISPRLGRSNRKFSIRGGPTSWCWFY